MRVLVVGGGGREHAIIRALKMSKSVTEVHAAPGSDGIAKDALCHLCDLQNKEEVTSLAQRKGFNLVIIGPENPLADGLADVFREIDIPVFGPNKEAARLEASKVFSKEFMIANNVPTARTHFVSTVDETMKAAKDFAPPYVLKADGLAAGKGVIICQSEDELKKAAQSMFEEKSFGDAGAKALLEEFQKGWEVSYLVLVDGEKHTALPQSQDHKRLLEKDLGPNTGGMGVVAPLKISDELKNKIEAEIVEPTLSGIRKNKDMFYRGVLYIGLMVTPEGPSVIEYNVRFGDPEIQAITPLLDGDWGEVFHSVATGDLQPLNWKPLHTACVVMAAEGYPEKPIKGIQMIGDAFAETASSYFLHAGTKCEDGHKWVTAGGRVMNSIGIGESIEEALKKSYEQAEKLTWPGQQLRKDIGQKILHGVCE